MKVNNEPKTDLETVSQESYIDRICRLQLLPDLAGQYIQSLQAEASDSGNKKHSRIPNYAGFCRYCGLNGYDAKRLKRDYPESYSALCFIFEDEALNSDMPASVLSSYLKQRLGYGEESDASASLDVGPLKLVFEHDINTDGE